MVRTEAPLTLECVDISSGPGEMASRPPEVSRADDNYVLINDSAPPGCWRLHGVALPKRKVLMVGALVAGAVLLFSIVAITASRRAGAGEVAGTGDASDQESEEVAPRECSQPVCISQALQMLQLMRVSAAPCTDFYEYACGRFRSSQRQHGKLYDVLDDIRVNSRRRQAEKLATIRSGGYDVWTIARNFFQSCLNAPHNSDREIVAMVKGGQEELGKLQLGQATKEEWNMTNVLLQLWKKHDADVFLRLERMEVKDGAMVVRLMPLPVGDTIRRGKDRTIRDQVFLLDDLLRPNEVNKCTDNRDCVDRFVKDVQQVARSISEALDNSGKKTATYHSLEQLQQDCSALNWTIILGGLFVHFPRTTKSILYDSSHMKLIDALLQTTEQKLLQQYVAWSYMDHYRVVIDTHHNNGNWEDVCLDLAEKYMPEFMINIHRSLVEPATETSAVRLLTRAVYSFQQPPAAAVTASLLLAKETSNSSNHHVIMSTVEDSGLNEIYGQFGKEFKSDTFYNNLQRMNALRRHRSVQGQSFVSSDQLSSVRLDGDAVVVPYSLLTLPLLHEHNPSRLDAAGLVSLVYREMARLALAGEDEQTRNFLNCVETIFDELLPTPEEHDRINLMQTVPMTMSRTTSVRYAAQELLALQLSYELYLYGDLSSSGALPAVNQLPQDDIKLFYITFAQTRCQHVDSGFTGLIEEWRTFPHRPMINRLLQEAPGFVEAFGCQQPRSDSVIPPQTHGMCSLSPAHPLSGVNVIIK